MNNSKVFTEDGQTLLARYCQLSHIAGWKIPLYLLALIGSGLAACGAMSFEWEIMSRIFSYLAGDDSEYWTPWVMGCSALIVVLGLHFLAMSRPNHAALSMIERITGWQAALFLFGMGIFLAMLIYHAGVGDILAGDFELPDIFPMGESDDAPALDIMGMLSSFISNAANPLAALAFSFGIGSLTFLSAYVTHSALRYAEHCYREFLLRKRMRSEDKADWQCFIAKQADYDALIGQWQDLLRIDDDRLKDDIADSGLTHIAEGIAPSQQALTSAKLMQREVPFADKPNLNIKEMEKRLSALSAISHTTLLNAMK